MSLLRTDRAIQVSTLAQKVGSPESSFVRSTIQPLVSLGAVEMSLSKVRATGAWRPVGAHITAVELKLAKWQSALRQADQFARSADRAWVVLDVSRSRAAVAQAGLFGEFGVGLALLAPDGELTVVQRPYGRRPEPWLRAMMAERAWAAAEDDVSSLGSPRRALPNL